MNFDASTLDGTPHKSRCSVNSNVKCNGDDAQKSDTTATLPLIPTLSQCSNAPPSRRLPQIRLRPRTRCNGRQDFFSCISPGLSEKLRSPQPSENSFAKRKNVLFQDSTLLFTPPNHSDGELTDRPSHDQGLTEAPTTIHSDKVCAEDGDSSFVFRSHKKARDNSPCLIQFQDSKTTIKEKISSIVTPISLVAFQATNASLEESITKPRPVRRILFPTSASAPTKGEKDSLSRQISSTGSAFQGS
jgi:hypothetical protein